MIVTATQDIIWGNKLVKAGESIDVTPEQYKKLLKINKVEKPAPKKEKKTTKPKAKKDYKKDAPDFS